MPDSKIVKQSHSPRACPKCKADKIAARTNSVRRGLLISGYKCPECRKTFKVTGDR